MTMIQYIRSRLGGAVRLTLLVCLLAACSDEDNTYQGPDHIIWTDTLTVLPVVDNEEAFDITLSAMRPYTYDRTVAVELIADKSNAISGYHFDLLSHTVVIPAGQLTASVKVRAYTDRLEVADSLGFYLRLLTDESYEWPLYGNETKVLLQKAKRFDIDDFTGPAIVTSTWMYNYMQETQRLIRVEKDPETTNRIILRDLYYDGYDVRLDLTSDDILNPLITFDEQVFAPTVEAFGTIYGNGKIMMSPLTGYTSYYSSLERFLFFYTYNYVEDVGVVGAFAHAVRFITEDEATLFEKQQ